MVKYYRTVSTRIEEPLFNAFCIKCEAQKKKPNTVLKEYIEGVVSDGKTEHKPERGEDSSRDSSSQSRVEADSDPFV